MVGKIEDMDHAFPGGLPSKGLLNGNGLDKGCDAAMLRFNGVFKLRWRYVAHRR